MRFYKTVTTDNITDFEFDFGKTIYQFEQNGLTLTNKGQIRFDMKNANIGYKEFAKYSQAVKKIESIIQLSHDREYSNREEYVEYMVSLLNENDFIQYETVQVDIPTELQNSGKYMFVNRLIGQTTCNFVVTKDNKIELVVFTDEKFRLPVLMKKLGYGNVSEWKYNFEIHTVEVN